MDKIILANTLASCLSSKFLLKPLILSHELLLRIAFQLLSLPGNCVDHIHLLLFSVYEETRDGTSTLGHT